MAAVRDRSSGRIVSHVPQIGDPFHTLHHGIARRVDLGYAAKVAYAVMCSFYRLDRRYPGHDTMAIEIGVATRGGTGRTTVSRIMKDLEAAGLLLVRQRGMNEPNEYELLPWDDDQDGRTNLVRPDAPNRFTRTHQNGSPSPLGKKERKKMVSTNQERRPVPLGDGQCFGCGGGHADSDCPSYGSTFRKG